jgi:hypothetical protein
LREPGEERSPPAALLSSGWKREERKSQIIWRATGGHPPSKGEDDGGRSTG